MNANTDKAVSLMQRYLVLLIVLTLSTSSLSFGFTPVNARAISLGGNVGVTPRGVGVVGWNPAYLTLQDSPVHSFYLPLINYGMRLGNDAFSFSTLVDYFQEDKLLTDTDKDNLLGFIEDESVSTGLEMYLPLLGIGFPLKNMNWVFSIDAITMTDIDIDKDLISIAFKGHGMDRFGAQRVFDDMDVESHAFSRAGLTGAKSFKKYRFLDEISAGFTLSFLYGGVYGRVEDASLSFYTDHDSLSADGYASALSGFNGFGYSLDLGFCAKMLTRRAIVGLSLINVVNKVNYSNGEHRIYSFNIEKAPTISELEDLEDWIDENSEKVDSLEEKVSISAHLPASVLLSGGFWLFEDMLLTGSLRQGLNDVVGGSTKLRLTAGFEYMLNPAFPVRAGIGIGGREGFTLGTGVGFRKGVWHTDIGFAYENGIITGAKGFSFGINMAYFFTAGETDPFKTREYWLKRAQKQVRKRTPK
ncbi:hypothetical protein HQ587_01640 [bacterium]|nr:hypothetical protein [bacterium]